ncbi:MAG: 3-dehydroquinate synthase [Aestuariivita sp.]|nr:3-dehydroquinate synthase [Aestuariivita sp.]
MTSRTIAVELKERSYDVEIGAGLLKNAGSRVAPMLRRSRVVIMTDETVARLHLSTLVEGLKIACIESVTYVMPVGESAKCWSELSRCVEWLLEQKIERNDILIAFGGGVVGDLVGFAAAIILRGIEFIQIPTTLLAQVDSSVGGKTGINSLHGKNLIGAFKQPLFVLADTDVLNTLSKREFLAGYAEIAKYSLLSDTDFFSWLEVHGPKFMFDLCDRTIEAIVRSVQIKAQFVAKDEREHGDRALLNLGHTFGHALEAVTGYSNRLLHGEAVALGCILALDLSTKLNLCSQEIPSRVRAHFQEMNMMWNLRDIKDDLPDIDMILEKMQQDKKVIDGQLRLILVRDIGHTFVADNVSKKMVKNTLLENIS